MDLIEWINLFDQVKLRVTRRNSSEALRYSSQSDIDLYSMSPHELVELTKLIVFLKVIRSRATEL